MSTRRLHVDQSLSAGNALHLTGDQAHYVGRVLRCRPGDEIALFNGDGHEYRARIEGIDRQAVALTIHGAACPAVESPLDLRLIQCISRGDRMDTVVQKAAELGVRRISPVFSEFSVVRLDRERSNKRLQHWRRISRSACEQCGRTVPPHIDTPCALSEVLAEAAGHPSTRLLLQPAATTSFGAVTPPVGGVEFLIGPEGGLSETERKQAAGAGFETVSLGPRTLRTETAAIAALTLAQALWGDLLGHDTGVRRAGSPY